MGSLNCLVLEGEHLTPGSSAHGGEDHTDPAWGREGIRCQTKEHLSAFLNLEVASYAAFLFSFL